jgi:hypothetical protein
MRKEESGNASTPQGLGRIENIHQDSMRIVAIGGSNTYAYALPRPYWVLLGQLLSRSASVPVFTTGSGQTVALANESEARFVNDVLSASPAIIIFEFGQHEREFKVAPDKFYETMKGFLSEASRLGGHALLIAPTLVNDPEKAKESAPYARVLRGLAAETRSIFLDPAELLKESHAGSGKWSRLFRHRHDHIHWSEEGHALVARMLAERLMASGWIPVRAGRRA